jgi:hypothetical protein
MLENPPICKNYPASGRRRFLITSALAGNKSAQVCPLYMDEYHACSGNRIKVIERCGFVTGHDFSRAVKCLKIKVGFTFHNRLYIYTVPYAGTRLIFIFECIVSRLCSPLLSPVWKYWEVGDLNDFSSGL